MSHRLLFVVSTAAPLGTQHEAAMLAEALPRDEFEVQVCVLHGGGPILGRILSSGAPLELIRRRGNFDVLAAWRLRRLIARLRPALVQTWSFEANTYGRLAALGSGVPRWVAVERSLEAWKQWPEWRLDRWLSAHTDALVVAGQAVREFHERHGLPGSRLTEILPGIDPCPAAVSSREALLQELGLPREARLVMAVGSLKRENRYHDLIWATDILAIAHPRVHLLIIGDGPLGRTLQRFAADVCIADHVHLLGHRADVRQLLPHAEMLWLGSNQHGPSRAALEAMAAGVPVVAADSPAARELVVPGETGYLFCPGDRAELARASHRLLEDQQSRRRMGETARQRVAARYSAGDAVAAYVQLYRNLLG